MLKAPFAPLMAQLTDRAGMMVSPKAAQALGDNFGTAPVCAGPYKFVERVAQDRIVVEHFADYWDKGKVHIDRIVYRPIQDSTVRLANLQSGDLDLIERLLATDVEEVQERQPPAARDRHRARLPGHHLNVGNGEKANNPLGKNPRCARPSSSRSTATPSTRWCSTAEGRQPVGQPGEPVPPAKYPTPKRDVARPRR